ncbi:tetratricopeptide repeat protein [Croceibacter atlanticus]|jgi:tetratricopeptide (TPR) repeat protein|uniref:TPR repeat protein n=1 Tax=Croceibacter atlanticus (strain ATCC BAA-628 / JCM 21780 / CIP 108009 / IAM 15332 / KCTC 12090 / HTCC2559) TaxID=216432 RepID=A3U871_CROAH|nr:tetratricopeptide repeat protein [Croceibacter atlanticus]EAP88438.1 TPR repeat protein [Croceibacter atlanticus HTCC2559]MBW4969428.1 tetratricopeptide repeat protein [Croceibacter atlanticus]HAT70670.1 tetratricopeptide repeat protein [Flavobacteriaceae bacterium]|tara:strand:+ start:347 stop:1738 length:1392 start_codon:yes stop_codon:yes gene_type:complete
MQLSHNEDHNFSLDKFESMLKTNDVLFFDADEFENIISHYLEMGKIGLAKRAIKLGLSQHPSSINLKLHKVEVLVFENKLDRANEILSELYLLEPTNEEIFIQKANIFSKQDNHKKAIEMLETALELTLDEADVYSLIGMEHLFMEDYENAKFSFMKCLEQDEEDYASLYNIVYCFDFLNQRKEAIDYLSMYLNTNPYCEVAWHQLGKQYFDDKDYEKALTAYDFAIISDDTFIGAYLEKGKVLEKLKRYNEAIENYRITLELDDPTAFAYLRIGRCFEKLGADDLALQHFTKCVHEDPLLDKGWIALTDQYLKKLDYQKALYFINKAIDIDEDNVLYWKRYAKINNRLKFYEEAERGYRKSLELGNYELETWITRCDILINLGEYNVAINNLLQAEEFYPDTAEIEYRLSGLHFLLNEGEKGYFHLNNGLKIDPEYHIIIEELFPMVFQRKSVKDVIKIYIP